MKYSRRRVLTIGSASVLALALGAELAPAALAEYGPLAVYQTTFSMNCNNPSVCGPNLGGFWGWAVFNSDGTADAQLTGCDHMQGGGPAAGAQHFSSDVSGTAQNPGWYIGPNGNFWINNETDTFTGRTGGQPQTITIGSEAVDTGIPATPGHWNVATLLGFKAPPGLSIQIQVTKIPNR